MRIEAVKISNQLCEVYCLKNHKNYYSYKVQKVVSTGIEPVSKV